MDLRVGISQVNRETVAPAWRPIHYLGSKLRIVGPVCELLDQLDPGRHRVCDLFAGSGTVSGALAPIRTVTAIDIQEYSRVLCSALLTPARIEQSAKEKFLSRVANSELRADLSRGASPLVAYEASALDAAGEGQLHPIISVIEDGSIITFEKIGRVSASPALSKAVKETCARLKQLGLAQGPRAVALRHLGGIYLSYQQAIDLAALLDAAHRSKAPLKYTLLAATLSTASDIVNTVGKQFAQPIRPRDADGHPKAHLVQKILRDRSIDVFATFTRWLDRYSAIARSEREHRIVRADYSVALARHCDDVGIVYADPPYTRDHYSRFYHALETMCLRDDPEISCTHPSSKATVGRGIYRVDRHQSPFCIVSQAPEAFASLFLGVRRLGVPLVLSYSPLAETTKPRPRVIKTSELVSLARGFFPRVELVSAGRFSHNKLNKSSLNSEVSHEAEVFLACL